MEYQSMSVRTIFESRPRIVSFMMVMVMMGMKVMGMETVMMLVVSLRLWYLGKWKQSYSPVSIQPVMGWVNVAISQGK